MSDKNSVSVTTSANDKKQTFAIKNPTNGKIIAFINFGQAIDEATANSLTGAGLKDIIGNCDVEKFTKSTGSDALQGLI